jgi:hypothetical protein
MRTVVVVLITLLLAGCNVFEPFYTPGSSDNVNDLISDAQDSLEKGEFREAYSIMEKAMTISPDDSRVRYLHAVAAVGAHGIDMLDVLDILQPGDTEFPVDAAGEEVLLMTDAELEKMYAAFQIVSDDLEPMVDEMLSSGKELQRLRESEDVLLSFGVSETILGMLRLLDNDDTENEFSLDERLIITKKPHAYELTVDDILLTLLEQDRIIDGAIERSWDRFMRGRHALYCYYEFVTNEVIWTGPVTEPPTPLPKPIDGSVTGNMVQFVDDGVTALYNEKEDLDQ